MHMLTNDLKDKQSKYIRQYIRSKPGLKIVATFRKSQDDLLYNEQNCYSGQNSVEENCTFDQYAACGDDSTAFPQKATQTISQYGAIKYIDFTPIFEKILEQAKRYDFCENI